VKYTQSITVRTQFSALHAWPDAPEEVAFLRTPHRHLFKVAATFSVTHADRQLEFFIVQRKLNKFLAGWEGRDLGPQSCEMMAEALMLYLDAVHPGKCLSVTVSEDGENDGTVSRALDTIPSKHLPPHDGLGG
jgi:hypothetical protein